MKVLTFNYSLVLIDIIFWFLIQFIIAYVISFLPNTLFNPYAFIFRSSKWENNTSIYNKYFKVRKWKNKLPVGKAFVKNDVNLREIKSKDLNYLNKYLIKSCKAEATHILSIISIITFLLWHNVLVTLLIFVFTFSINLPFIIIQRYNRERIIRLIKRIEK